MYDQRVSSTTHSPPGQRGKGTTIIQRQLAGEGRAGDSQSGPPQDRPPQSPWPLNSMPPQNHSNMQPGHIGQGGGGPVPPHVQQAPGLVGPVIQQGPGPHPMGGSAQGPPGQQHVPPPHLQLQGVPQTHIQLQLPGPLPPIQTSNLPVPQHTNSKPNSTSCSPNFPWGSPGRLSQPRTHSPSPSPGRASSSTPGSTYKQQLHPDEINSDEEDMGSYAGPSSTTEDDGPSKSKKLKGIKGINVQVNFLGSPSGVLLYYINLSVCFVCKIRGYRHTVDLDL